MFETVPPPRGVVGTERQQEADRCAAGDRIREEHGEVGDRLVEGRSVEPPQLQSHAATGMTCSTNASSASQSYGAPRTAMLRRSAPASRNAVTVSVACDGVPRRKPVNPRVSAPHSRW